MLKAVIIDDEVNAIKSLSWEIEKFCPEIRVVGWFVNPAEATIFLKENPIDVLFLDIEMPSMDGFQFLSSFGVRDFVVVITTAFDQYAIKAIKEQAFDYLLKPIDTDDLLKCVEKIKSRKPPISMNDIDKLEKLLENHQLGTNPHLKKIKFMTDGKIMFFNPNDILYCKSEGNYTMVYTESQKGVLIGQNLKSVEEKLLTPNFYRVHNSFLVNLDKVSEFHKAEEYLVLSHGHKVPVSRNKKLEILDKI